MADITITNIKEITESAIITPIIENNNVNFNNLVIYSKVNTLLNNIYYYRYSNTSPTLSPSTFIIDTNNIRYNIIDSNLINEGWGDITPSSWILTQDYTIFNDKYIQLKIII